MQILQHTAQPPGKTGLPTGKFTGPRPASPLQSNVIVLKVSGKICEPSNLAVLAKEVGVLIAQGHKVVLVHGGGKQINAKLAEAGIATEVKAGKRVTPPEAVPIVASALAEVNAQITTAMINEGISTIGVDGIEHSPVHGTPLEGYERTGVVSEVDSKMLNAMLHTTDVVVLSCLSHDTHGMINVNADDVATAVAASMKTKKLILLSDVKGVLGNPLDADSILPIVDGTTAKALIDSGVVTAGMISKIKSCIGAVEAGVGEITLADGNGLSLLAVLNATTPCTRFVQ